MSLTKSLFATAAFMVFTSVSAHAAETVNFTMKASMPSLRDAGDEGQFHRGACRQAGGHDAEDHLPGGNRRTHHRPE